MVYQAQLTCLPILPCTLSTPHQGPQTHTHVHRQAAHIVPDPPLCPALQIICLFLQPINDHSDGGDYFQLVEPMGYRIPSCLIYMGCSATLGDRLFLGGNDGHLYELQHSRGHPSMRLVRGVPACSRPHAWGGLRGSACPRRAASWR